MAARLDFTRSASSAMVALVAAPLGVLAGLNPGVAIGASICFAFILLGFANLSLGLALFTFLSFMEILSVSGPVVSLTKLLGLMLALSWIAQLSTREEARAEFLTVHPGASYILAFFLCWSALSSLWAESTPDTLTSTYRLTLNVVLYLIVFTAVRNRKSARMTIAAFVAGATASAAYGLVVGAESVETSRLSGGILDPNELGAVLVPGIMLSLGIAAMPRRTPGTSAIAAGLACFQLAALFLTASRGGLVALAVALAAGVLFAGRWRLPLTILAVGVAAGAYIYFSALAPREAQDRIAEATSGEVRQVEGRTTIWQVGWRMFESNPVQGVGGGNFSKAAIHYVLEPGAAPRSDRIVDTPAVAHNSYLETFAELGVVGGAAFLAIIGFSFGSAVVAARRFGLAGDLRMEVLSRAFLAALAGALAADFFISQQFSKQFWLLLGLGPALLAIATARPEGGRLGAADPDPDDARAEAPHLRT